MKLLKFSTNKQLLKVRVLGYRTVIVFVALVVAGFNFFYAWQPSQKVSALETTKMLLFWDGTDVSVPGGWSLVASLGGNSIIGKFPRGEAPANALQQGVTGAHAPTPTGNLTSINESGSGNNTAGSNAASYGHIHSSPNPTIATSSNSDEPAFRSLKLIQYDAGIPTSIPGGVIVLFSANPGAGWTRYASQDDKMIKVDSTVTTGGSDTHSHQVTWSSLSATSNVTGHNASAGNNVASAGHTHAAPATQNTSDLCSDATSIVDCMPPHVKPLMYKADSTISAPNDMIALFDANPGGGWAVQSNAGGTFYQQFMRPASAYNGATAGTATHTHPAIVSANTATCAGGCSLGVGGGAVNTTSTINHTHYRTAYVAANDENMPDYFNVVVAKKSLPSMLLFWDGSDGSIPVGWSKVNDYNGRFPRGEAPGNFGDIGGDPGVAGHTHTNQAVSRGVPSGTRGAALGSGTGASAGHTHSNPSVSTISTTSNDPAYRNLKLIKFDAGIPNIIPAGGITIFDNSPGIPALEQSPGNPYWSQYTAQTNTMVRVDTTATGTGGSDNHTHSVTWTGSLGASAGTTSVCLVLTCNAPGVSPNGHTHTAPGATTSISVSGMPPYIGILLGKANFDTATLSTGLTAMFDGDPGSGWVIQSSSGGKYYQKFLRAEATYNEAGGGATNHTHTATGNSGTASGTGVNANDGTVAALGGHTHPVTSTFVAGTSESGYVTDNEYFLPLYFNVIVAEKVDFRLESYRWYEDSNALDVTEAWSIFDVPQNTALRTLPTAYMPPDSRTELRLRIKILVNNNNLLANDVAYKMQYKRGTDSSCTTDTWTDVGVGGGGEIWRFATSGVSDGANLLTPAATYSRLSPVASVMQVYSKSNPTASNPNPVTAGSTMEYDFHIEHNGAAGATQYSFRIVEDGDILLSEYSVCPTLVTKPQSVNQLRHGNFFEEGNNASGTEKGFSWVD